MDNIIAYRLGGNNILYLNIIKKHACQNSCLFCERPTDGKKLQKLSIYEDGFSLYRENMPSVEEVITAVKESIRKSDQLISFVGLGEPLIYLPEILEMIKEIKLITDTKINVNTNGLIESIYPNAAAQLDEVHLDRISISLNATNAEDYQKVSRSELYNPFPLLLSFIKNCLASKNIETYVSFITDFPYVGVLAEKEEEYLEFAKSIGLPKERVRFRKYAKL